MNTHSKSVFDGDNATSGNTNAPSITIDEKCDEMVLSAAAQTQAA